MSFWDTDRPDTSPGTTERDIVRIMSNGKIVYGAGEPSRLVTWQRS